MATSLLFVGFLVLTITMEPYTWTAVAVRAGLALYLALFSLALWKRLPLTREWYPAFVGTGGAAALGAILVLLVVSAGEPRSLLLNATPALVFGLFLHYAFLRLPLTVASTIGWGVTLLSIAWASSVASGAELLRNAVYLSAANVFGMILLRMIEAREQELFLQRHAEAVALEAVVKQAEAEEALRRKTQLIAAVSHDLRQPMLAAASYADVLSSRLTSRDLVGAHDANQKVRSAVNLLGETLDHLLAAARYDTSAEVVSIEPIELAAILRDIYDSNVEEAERLGVELRIRCPNSVCIATDSHSLRRVLGNLVSNAIKFSQRDGEGAGRVLVAVRCRGAQCRIDVLDTGIGISGADQERIWEPFVQLDKLERDRARGLGLGLYLVKTIVGQLPGHSIDMKSVLERGSRFTIMAPLATRPASVLPRDGQGPGALSVDASILRGAYVILIEDDRDARLALEELLGEWQVIVTSSANLGDLTRAVGASERTVDAVICDYRLPGGTNGVDAIVEIRNALGYAPGSILITGEADVAGLAEQVVPGAAVLQKPFGATELAAPLIAAVLASRMIEQS